MRNMMSYERTAIGMLAPGAITLLNSLSCLDTRGTKKFPKIPKIRIQLLRCRISWSGILTIPRDFQPGSRAAQ
jgi:hypothetical protein